MWNPIRIHFENLFSHVDSSYEFKNNSCVVIFGENKTDRSLENNGAGKTTLFEAICIALTNESLRNIKKEQFINRDADSCYIEFELYNPVMRMNLRICRRFFRGGKSVEVKVYENGERNTQVVSVAEANKRVLELIGIGREDLLRYFIISQDNHYTFFTASDTEKKEIMNRITSADMINPALEELNNRKAEKTAVYNGLVSEIDKLSGKRETLAEQKQDILNNDSTREVIEELGGKISDAEKRIDKNNEIVESCESEILEIQKQIKALKIPDVSQLKAKRKALKAELDSLEEDSVDLNRVKRNISSELKDTIECPNCGHEFIHKSELGLTVEDAQRLLGDTEKEIKSTAVKIDKKNSEIENITKKIKEGERAQEQHDELESDLSDLQRKLRQRSTENTDLKIRISRWRKDIEELKNKKNDNSAIKKIDEKIAECERELSVKQKELIPIEEELNMIRFWQFHMGKSGFQTFLANKSVKIIEGITNSYLRKFGVDISVLINGFTILRSGEVREKIDVFISNDGVTAENFMGHSGGERGRVMLAGVLGIQHLINMSLDGKGINLLLMDECFHGMDSRGQENIIKIFERMGITMIVITQNVSESFNNENTLRVVKENGVSRYIV